MASSIQLGLDRIVTLLTHLRSPHIAVPIVHIAGTNGKGSVSAYLSSILASSGIDHGRFNSPHLVDEWDGVSVVRASSRQEGSTVDDGEAVYRAAKAQVVEADRLHGVGASSFELVTATAFLIFARAKPPLSCAVVEVGMGGATDATNVVPADKTLLSILTNVEMDHESFLGSTVEEIAKVKTDIMRHSGDLVVSQQAHAVVDQVAAEVGQARAARVHYADRPSTSKDGKTSFSLLPRDSPTGVRKEIQATPSLPGTFQLANAATSVLASQVLRTSPRCLELLPALSQITDEAISKGLETTRWPGRVEWLTLPSVSGKGLEVLIDGAHNPSSAASLAEYLATLPPVKKPSTLVFAMTAGRDVLKVFGPIAAALQDSLRRVICVEFSEVEGMPWVKPTSSGGLAEILRGNNSALEVIACDGGFKAALEQLPQGEPALIAGSLYLVADVYRVKRKIG